MILPHTYRENAAKCRELSTTTRDPQHRARFLEIANSWDELAVWRELNLQQAERIRTLLATTDQS